MPAKKPRKSSAVWYAVFLACTVPLWLLAWKMTTDGLGPNPIEAITRFLGDWALRFLLLGLAFTPLRRFAGWNGIMRYRRMVGLFAFTFVTLHLLSYGVLDHFLDWGEIGRDIVKRPYITIGMLCFTLLAPLAATSTNGMVRRIGGRAWQRLHRLVYPIAVLGVVHYLLLVKADITQPLIYGAVLAVLLGLRAAASLRRGRRVAARPAPQPS